ncbi:MAG: PAS domain S-box protein, partial [Deltaproteobacteria bacterium]|nr:PAS domain S-box protein [Deltaproteobacteria bacterium]MBW2533177.1 PAS domain S-box protein [Deltaproteobacteria bacterium]
MTERDKAGSELEAALERAERRAAALEAEVERYRTLEEDYRQLFQTVPAAIYEIDLSGGRFVRVNDQMCEHLGYSREELLAMHPRDLLGEASRELEAERIARRMRGEAVPELVEFQIRTKDGRDLWVLLNMRVHFDLDGGLRASVVAQDVTARRRLDAELQNVQKLESLGVLAGGIAHDFHNLLTTILGGLSLAQRAASDPGRVSRHCGDAIRACHQAKRLTQQLLTFSEGGAPAKQTTAIRPLVEDCTHFALDRSSVRCAIDLPEDVWPLDADEGQIAQVMSNLVINARQAMPDGGRVRIGAANTTLEADDELPLQSGRYVRLTVADDGPGIPPEVLPKIFDPFFSTKDGGTGLGLTAAHSIVQRHGGHLAV